MKKLLVKVLMAGVLIVSPLYAISEVDQSQINALTIKKLEAELYLREYGSVADKEKAVVKAQADLDEKRLEQKEKQGECNKKKTFISDCQKIIDSFSGKKNLSEVEKLRLNTAMIDQIGAKQELEFCDIRLSAATSKVTKAEKKVTSKKDAVTKEKARLAPYEKIVKECTATIKELSRDEKAEKAKKDVEQAKDDYWKNYEVAMKKRQANVTSPKTSTPAATANLDKPGKSNATAQPSVEVSSADENEDSFVAAKPSSGSSASNSSKPSSSTTSATSASSATTATKVENTTPTNTQPESVKKPSGPTYKVVSGDNLSKIAKNLLGSASRYSEIIELNKDKYPSLEKNANLIYPGWEFVLPASESKPAVVAAPAAAAPVAVAKPAVGASEAAAAKSDGKEKSVMTEKERKFRELHDPDMKNQKEKSALTEKELNYRKMHDPDMKNKKDNFTSKSGKF